MKLRCRPALGHAPSARTLSKHAGRNGKAARRTVGVIDDKVHLLAGMSGLLVTSFKLFVDGVSGYARTFPSGAEKLHRI